MIMFTGKEHCLKEAISFIFNEKWEENIINSFVLDNIKCDEEIKSFAANAGILFNSENGCTLISAQICKIIDRIPPKDHITVLTALKNGLEKLEVYDFQIDDILSNIEDMVDNLTSADLKKIKDSESKTDFKYLKKNYRCISKHLDLILEIKEMFWPNIDPNGFTCIKVYYDELVQILFMTLDEDEDKLKVLKYIDRFLVSKGITINERCQLVFNIVKKYGIPNLNIIDLIRKNKNKVHYLRDKRKLSFNKELDEKIDGGRLHKFALNLDIQLSLVRINNSRTIQPLINLIEYPQKLSLQKRHQEAYKFLRENDYLKKTEKGNYIFDSINKQSYMPVDVNKLGNFLTIKYPVLKAGIEKAELESILNLSGEFDDLHNEYYLFNNGVLLLHERAFIETDDFKDYFSIKKMNCNLKIESINKEGINDSPHCLVDRVLREILIPNYKEGKQGLDYGFYFDFLERVGSAFNTRIKEKKFACYYGRGDNGKDILIEILKMAFGDRCLLATMDILQDEKADLSEYDVVIIDELDKLTFNDAIAFIKRITGGEEEGTAKRQLYSHEIFRPKNPSAFFLFTNEIPGVQLTDTAFYRREDILELQNHFIENPNADKPNEFQADSSLKDKIKNCSEDNVEWLINTGINAYYNCYNEEGYFKGFTKAQTAEETKMLVSNTDPLSKFLRETYVEDEDKQETISNRDIQISYENYCQRNNLTINKRSLPIILGNTIKKVFGDVKKKATKDTLYYLKVKDGTDNNTPYYINTNHKWYEKKEEIPEAEFDNFEKVYFRIHELSNQGVVPTKKQLKEEFKYLDVEKILSTLESADLIFKGKQ